LEIANYIKPELLILVAVCYIIGAAAKRTSIVQDKRIPILLGGVAVVLACIWVCATSALSGPQEVLMALFTAITQGVLCAGASVYANQLFKQHKKEE